MTLEMAIEKYERKRERSARRMEAYRRLAGWLRELEGLRSGGGDGSRLRRHLPQAMKHITSPTGTGQACTAIRLFITRRLKSGSGMSRRKQR